MHSKNVKAILERRERSDAGKKRSSDGAVKKKLKKDVILEAKLWGVVSMSGSNLL